MNFVSLESQSMFVEGHKIHYSPRDQSLSDLLYSKTNSSNWWKTKADFEKHAEIPATSGHPQLRTLIKCNSGPHFACNRFGVL